MSNTKHTPGSYISLETTGHFPIKITSGPNEGMYSVDVMRSDGFGVLAVVFGKTEEECRANAKLIASAPEMLEALSQVAEFLGHIEPKVGEQAFAHIHGIVESAIKKATE